MSWGVLVGGQGSNLRAILDSGLPVAWVVSHRPGVRALDVARAAGVGTTVLDPRDYRDRAEYDRALVRVLRAHGVRRVAMAGFLRWLEPATIAAFDGQIINIHPSLLPSFPGLHAVEQAYRHGVRWTGVTVHAVDEGQDTGPIIAQIPVPCLPGDTLETLTERIHRAEHRLYPRVLAAIDRGLVELANGAVIWKGDYPQWNDGLYSASAINPD